jgi:hypothetical protein
VALETAGRMHATREMKDAHGRAGADVVGEAGSGEAASGALPECDPASGTFAGWNGVGEKSGGVGCELRCH